MREIFSDEEFLRKIIEDSEYSKEQDNLFNFIPFILEILNKNEKESYYRGQADAYREILKDLTKDKGCKGCK